MVAASGTAGPPTALAQAAIARDPALAARLAQLKADASTTPPPAPAATLRARADALASAFLRRGDPAGAGLSRGYASMFATRAGDLDGGVRVANQALAECRRGREAECEGRALLMGGIALRRRGDHEAALARYGASAAIFTRLGQPEQAAKALMNSANAQYDIGDVEGALATYRRLAAEFRDPALRYVATLNAALLLIDRSRFAEAKAAAQQALAMRGRGTSFAFLNDPVCSAIGALGRAKAHLGDASGLASLRECVRAAERTRQPAEIYLNATTMADSLVALQRPREALPFVQLALANQAANPPQDVAQVYRLAALAHAADGERDAALAMADRAFQTMRRSNEAVRSTAVAAAMSRAAVSERDALLQLTRARADLERERAERRLVNTRLGAVAVLGTLALIAVFAFGRFRLAQQRRRQAAVLAERTRVARELHDTLIQGFTGVALQLQAAAEAEPSPALRPRLTSLAREAGASLAEARSAVWQMRSPLVEAGDLKAALAAWLGTQDGGPRITHALDALPDRLPQATTEALLRVAQEAVTNARRHGRPGTVTVEAATAPGRARLIVRDDGQGFEPTGAAALGGHWGLLGMRERLERLGGSLSVTSAPGRGTEIVAEAPI